MLAVYVLLAIAAFAVYLYLKYPDRAVGTRPRPDIPNADGTLPIIGSMVALTKNSQQLHEFLLDQARKKGEVFRVTLPQYPESLDMVVITNVQDLEHVLRDPWLYEKGEGMRSQNTDLFGHGIFSSDGDLWKVQRKVASNIFNVKNFRDFYTPVFLTSAKRVAGHLDRAAELGAYVDIQDLLLRSTMDSFVKMSMGSEMGCLTLEPKVVNGKYTLPYVEFPYAFDTLNNIVAQRFSLPMWEIAEKLNGRHAKKEWCRGVLHGEAQKIIDQKRKARAEGKAADSGPMERGDQDLLDYFLATENDDGSPITDEQLRDVVINFIVAGRDTTAQTLSWVFYELSRHPEVMAKVRAEAFAVLGKERLAEYKDIANLKYLNAVFNEVLRLWANVPFNFKHPVRDDVLPGSKIKVYKGQRVAFVPYAMGRLERIWGPDADELRPERWIDASGSLIKENTFKWPVFNAGPRICLGMNMAIQQGLTLMSTLCRKFDFELVNEDDPEKWAVYDKDPSKRRGRYDIQVTLAVRKSMDFKIHRVAPQAAAVAA